MPTLPPVPRAAAASAGGRSGARAVVRAAKRIPSLARRHPVFAVLSAVGLALRVVVEVAYRPALIFPDSFYYFHFATHPGKPGDIRTTLYSDLIAPVTLLHAVWLIPVVQHLLGLAAGVLGYALLLRWGCRKWLAAVAGAALLLDPLALILEHYVLTDALSVFVVLAALAVLTWQPRRLSRRAAVSAGLLLAASVLLRAPSGILVIPVAAYLAAAIRPWRLLLARGAAVLVVMAIPLAAWAFWFHQTYGPWSLSDYGGRFMYGRIAQFADCNGLTLPSYERALCPRQPPSQRNEDFYMWDHHSPQWRFRPPHGTTPDTAIGDFDHRVLEHQPLAYARVVGTDYVYGFTPVRGTGPERYPERYLQFQPSFPTFTWSDAKRLLAEYGHAAPRWQPQLGRLLQLYGESVYVPGPLVAVCILAALAAAAGLGPARRSPQRTACLLFGLTALLVTLPAAAVSTFDWRYQLPQIVLAPMAAALAVAAVIPRARATPGDTARTAAGTETTELAPAETPVPVPE